ncbi:MAG TPA: hypothetical protein VGQ79_07220 [Nitrospiraceae bacterium]|nr:hypothetical protein [Nitrospiraceae bacterium]
MGEFWTGQSYGQCDDGGRGTVLVKDPRISFAQRAWEQTARIFIRESGA